MPNKNYKGFTKIEKLVSQTAKQYNLENALYKHQAIKHWTNVAAAFVQESANLTQAVDFKKGVLTVACLSREVASKLRLLADRIISALNEMVGRKVVFAIYIEV
jgi:predicted nucleic acid-binding Zn ribbon protein